VKDMTRLLMPTLRNIRNRFLQFLQAIKKELDNRVLRVHIEKMRAIIAEASSGGGI